jgi:prevent-host-death family protein
MKIATITEVKNGLSAWLDRVRAGETILIVDRGRPVARLEPAILAGDEPEGRLSRLQRAGLVRVAPEAGPVMRVLTPPRTRSGASVVEALLEERGEGR